MSSKYNTTVISSVLIGAVIVLTLYLVFTMMCDKKAKEAYVDFSSYEKAEMAPRLASDRITSEDLSLATDAGNMASRDALRLYNASALEPQRVDMAEVYQDQLKSKYENYALGGNGGMPSVREMTTAAIVNSPW